MSGDDDPHGHSPSDTDEAAQADMAQMMGFSSFGSKPNPQSKKRKREIAQLAASGPGAESGSGSNTMPLGKPRRKPVDVKDEEAGNYEQSNVTGETVRFSDEHQQILGDQVPEEAVPDRDWRKESAKPSASQNAFAQSTGGRGQAQQDLYALRKGVRDQRGDVAYYNPSFIEDPWKDLR